MLPPRRGEIYWVDWSPSRGSEQSGRRPGLVISADAFNRAMPVCTVLAITSKIKPSRIGVNLPASITGEECQIMPWQMMTISADRLLGEPICMLDDSWMSKVQTGLKALLHF